MCSLDTRSLRGGTGLEEHRTHRQVTERFLYYWWQKISSSRRRKYRPYTTFQCLYASKSMSLLLGVENLMTHVHVRTALAQFSSCWVVYAMIQSKCLNGTNASCAAIRILNADVFDNDISEIIYINKWIKRVWCVFLVPLVTEGRFTLTRLAFIMLNYLLDCNMNHIYEQSAY